MTFETDDSTFDHTDADNILMQKERAEPFSDNWTYLKAELHWLDRVLMLAVARQRKDVKEVERVAQTRADRVTSHWWKGIIFLEEEASYDDCAPRKSPPTETGAKVSFQQQLETRIECSHQRGIHLSLPSVRSRLNLNLFEKNLILMSLAPEVNRRYARIYSYLQGGEVPNEARSITESLRVLQTAGLLRGQTDLLTIDLVLRILCRNDAEWREGRTLLTKSPLVQHHLLEISGQEESFLARRLKLSDALVNYLLAENPTPQGLEALLLSRPTVLPALRTALPLLQEESALTQESAVLPSLNRLAEPWSRLILPPPLMDGLQHLCQRIWFGTQVETSDTIEHPIAPAKLEAKQGSVVLLSGPLGTGKTTAVATVAQALKTPLVWVDLAHVKAEDYEGLIQEIESRSPTVLLLKSAQVWFGRSSPLPPAVLHQFLSQRLLTRGLTFLSVRFSQSVRPVWQREFNRILEFTLPQQDDRLRLWHQAFPPDVTLDSAIDWEALAQWPLSGGEIHSIAQTAMLLALDISGNITVQPKHILQAWFQESKHLDVKSLDLRRAKVM